MEENINVNETLEEMAAREAVDEIKMNNEPLGPSKGFTALVIGGLAAVAIGATIAIRRCTRKRVDVDNEEEFFEDDKAEAKPKTEEVEPFIEVVPSEE